MSTWSDEDLSRLLDAELDFEQAKQLREDLETDPELAARWEKLLSLDADLSALDEHPAPPHLDAAILETAPAPEAMAPSAAPSKRWAYVLLAAGLLLAATPLLALTDWAQEPAQLAVASGSQWVQGPALVLLPDGHSLRVEGSTLLSVEPVSPLPRVWGEEDEMNPKLLLAAAAGAAITVSVYEGRAWLTGPQGEPLELAAGQTHATTPPAEPTTDADSHAQPAVSAPSAAAPADLERELQRLRLKNQFLEGQLSANGIRPNEWPEDLPGALEPDKLRATLQAQLADYPQLRLLDVDCSEYPCMAVLEDLAEEPDRMNLEPVRDEVQQRIGGELDSRVSGGLFDDGEGVRYIEAWALLAPGADAGTEARTDMRAQEILTAASEQE